MEATNAKVQSAALEVLVDLQLTLSSKVKRGPVWLKFLGRVMGGLKTALAALQADDVPAAEADAHRRKLGVLLQLLTRFMNRLQQTADKPPPIGTRGKPIIIQVYLHRHSEMLEQHQILVDKRGDTFGQLREFLAKMLNSDISLIRMKAKHGIFHAKDFDHLVSAVCVCTRTLMVF